MKKIILIFMCGLLLNGCGAVLIGSAIVTGVNVAHDRRSSGQVLDDKIITASVKNEIRKQVEEDTRIKVDTYNGVVLLAGEVENSQDRIRAEDAAAVKDGVMKVVNQLKTVEEVSKMGRRTKDKYIASKAKGSLLKIDIPDFDPTRVKITVANGEVFLMGKVTRAEADAVVERVRHLRGVHRVVKVFEYKDV
ncbi:BON domain-containing protein [Marinicella gelatinilytica]|uniref:BON domain-containing protein n=1 Tax=Marinicella gelatinilytica TaxID=2996017 RepID=UPI002260E0F1|nr:BON domain-containing protein [Marinicella gelatinilytica]MCX7544064.1 BON domain-containing protein [Marinicella gelatinilytica]